MPSLGAPGAGLHRVDDPVAFDGPYVDHAVEVAPRIWWVGNVLADDPFQSHPYLIEAGDQSVLVDPGSELTIGVTLDKVGEVVDLDQIGTILLHHSDPDCADAVHRLGRLLRDDVRIVTEWRSELLLRHLAPRFPIVTIEDLGWVMELEPGRTLEFLLTPYLHFPGAFVTHETSTRSLFSADLFGGFNHGRRLWATGPDDFEDLRRFHEHYMPSREILMSGLAAIRSRFGRPDRLLPQHGYVVPQHLVNGMFDALFSLDCGVMLLSQSDTHLATLIEAAAAARRIEDVLNADLSLSEILATVERIATTVFPIDSLAIERSEPDGSLRRYEATAPDGVPIDARAVAGPTTWVLALGADDGPRLVLELGRPDDDIPDDIRQMFAMLLPRARPVLERILAVHVAERDRETWERNATTDPLTALDNRHTLEPRSVAERRCAVIMIDLDRFKSINDRWGHLVGDEILRRSATAVRSVLRVGDRAVRYGGEEFLVVAPLHEQHGDSETVRLAERIHDAIGWIDTSDITPGRPLSASVGATVASAGTSFATAVERADLALYRSKRLGRDRVEIAATPRPGEFSRPV